MAHAWRQPDPCNTVYHSFYSNLLATWCKELTHLKRSWCWERLKAGGEGDDRGWDGWMASPTRCTWVWVNSRSWWWDRAAWRAAIHGLQRVGHDWETELNWSICIYYEESWVPKNWCFWTVVLEKTLESPLDCKEILPVHAKGNQFWIFIGRTDVEAETPILDAKSWLIWKDGDAGKDWRQEEKGMTEDEMVGWHQTQWTWVWVNSRSWW